MNTDKIFNHKTDQDDDRIAILLECSARRVRRNGTDRYSYVNEHGDFIQIATVTLFGEKVRVKSIGIGSPWYTVMGEKS